MVCVTDNAIGTAGLVCCFMLTVNTTTTTAAVGTTTNIIRKVVSGKDKGTQIATMPGSGATS